MTLRVPPVEVGLARRSLALSKSIQDACEKNWFWLLAAFSALYAILVGTIAVRNPLENDELFTLNIARLPGMNDVWSALHTGAEQLPPFFYIVTRASLSLLGENNLALRLPAIVGFWVMGLCLFRFVAKRSTALHGLAAMLLPLTTGAYYYAFNARPYGLVLGFTGLALICWQSLSERDGRVLPLAGLSLSLAAAVACHYYAILVLVPLGFGEAAKLFARRRAALSVWAAMAASLAPLLLFLPLILGARSYSGTFWAKPSWGDTATFYYFMMASAAMPLTAIVLLAALHSVVSSEDGAQVDGACRLKLLPHETFATIGFLFIPVIAVAAAMFVTNAFTPRYALPAILGLCILLTLGIDRLLSGREGLTILLLLCLAAGFVRRTEMTLQASSEVARNRQGTVELLQDRQFSELPVVCADAHIFLVLSHEAPPEVQSRLVYLADPKASLRYLGHNSVERGMLDLLKTWFGLNVQQYEPYIVSRPPFLLLGDPQSFLNWLLRDLISSGAHLELLGRNEAVLLFRVRYGLPE